MDCGSEQNFCPSLRRSEDFIGPRCDPRKVFGLFSGLYFYIVLNTVLPFLPRPS